MSLYRIREFPESNYRAIYYKGKTLRIALNPDKPITELQYPEFYDIKITNKCNSGCWYCYQNSTENADHYNCATLLHTWLSSMSMNQKPFQIAVGGGEPTLHPDFSTIMNTIRTENVSPTYTTNGMFIQESNGKEILESTKEYCEGVAVTCHPHLHTIWTPAVKAFIHLGIFTSLHILIHNYDSIRYFSDIFYEYKDIVNYFVLLPMVASGRATDKFIPSPYTMCTDLNKCIKGLLYGTNDRYKSKLAFGAKFYPYMEYFDNLDVSLYEPEIMSKYIDMKTWYVYRSSFDTNHPIYKYMQ